MRVLKNILSQLHSFALWLIVSVIFWGWIFTLVTDAPPAQKVTVYCHVPGIRDTALAAALEEHMPEGLRMIKVHSFDYVMFDVESIGLGDVFIIPASEIETYAGSLAPVGEEPGVRVYDAAAGSGAAAFAGNAAIVVTGTWAYTDAKAILGDNLGAAELPSFTVDGKTYHIGSYNGCKLMGIKPQTDAVKGAALHQLAQYLTNQQCQLERFDEFAWGPSNLEAQKSEAVQANPAQVALAAQAPYSIAQPTIHGSWWDLAKVIGDDVRNATDDAGIQAALDKYEENMAALFTMSDEVRNAFTVIGSINGDTWTLDLPMTESGGVWTTNEAYAMDAGVEFKVRQGKSWDTAYPADNFVVETAGTYYIQLDAASGTVSLLPADVG